MNKSTKNDDWQRILVQVLAGSPELLTKTVEERRAEFNRISDKIARNLPYKNLEEFEHAMRPRMIGISDSTTLHPCHFSKGENIDRPTLT